MSDDEVCGLIGAYVFLGLAIWSGIWWLIVPLALLAVACTLAAISVAARPAVPSSEIDRIERPPRAIHRSLDAD